MTTLAPQITIHIEPKAAPDTNAGDWLLLGDELLSEYNKASRTAPVNNWPSYRHPCTPSVMRFYKEPIDQQGDFRVDISPMLDDYLSLNRETKITDPKTRYFFGKTTALFNTTGYPKQMYTTMQGNILRGVRVGDWLRFETLTPYRNVRGMSHETHPHFIHRFDLVCYKQGLTYHKPTTPQGIIDYFCVTVEGVGYIPIRYVVKV
jgi:hypothetical protein